MEEQDNSFTTTASLIESNKELRRILQDSVEVIDQLMPGVAHLAGIDIGLLNDTLVSARKLGIYKQ